MTRPPCGDQSAVAKVVLADGMRFLTKENVPAIPLG